MTYFAILSDTQDAAAPSGAAAPAVRWGRCMAASEGSGAAALSRRRHRPAPWKRTAAALPPADGGDDDDGAVGLHRRLQALQPADVVAVHEHVHVPAQLAGLVDHA